MKRVFGTLTFGLAAAAAGLAQPYNANETGTITATGPRAAPNGDNFMNAEGSALAPDSSYAALRWDLSTLKANLNLQFGVNNWRVTNVEVALVQSNAAFSATGDVRMFYSTDDATDIKTAGSPLTYPFQNTPGTPDLACNLADPIASWTFVPIATGTEEIYNVYTDGQGGEKLALANDIQNDAGNKLTLVIEDITATVAATYRGQIGTGTAHAPELRVTAVAISGNPPTANAGADQSVTDTDVSGSESVTLDGSASHANPPATSIVTYSWTEGGSPIASGVSPTANFTVGSHTVQLTVTDNLGGTSSDTVLINVLSGVQIVANAGANSTVTAGTCDGTASVTLDGTGSTYNAGTITTYTWTNDYDGSAVANTATANVSLGVGTHTFRLVVVGSGGETDQDVRTIDVRPAGVFAGHDFDGQFANFVNIVPSGPFTSPGDAFGVLQRGTGNIPFGLVDDTLATFVADVQGVVNDKKLDAWFGSHDLQNNDNTGGTGTAEFGFTISGRSNIQIAIDMGAMGDYEATGTVTNVADEYTFTAVVDGGAPITVFTIRAEEAGSMNYRLASGTLRTLNDPLWVDSTTYLKNILRTFTFPLGVTGNSLTLTLTASTNGDDEAFVFDNILLYECSGGGDPCPCPGDVNNDGVRDISDLGLFLASFGLPATNCADVNGDGIVDISDLGLFLAGFGVPCP